MPVKTLSGIRAQIERLQAEAAQLEKRERVTVLERVRDAVTAYSLTVQEVFKARKYKKLDDPKPKATKATRKKGPKLPAAASKRRVKGKASPKARLFVRGATYEINGRRWTATGRVPQWVIYDTRGALSFEQWRVADVPVVRIETTNRKVA